jgi:CHASE3 domain sensor protein
VPGLLDLLRRRLTPAVIATLLPLAVVGVVGRFLSWRYQAGLREDRALMAHTWEVIAATAAVLTAALDAETGQRGYVLTGDAAFLAPYDDALSSLPRRSDELAALVGDNPDQQGRVGRLRDALDRKSAELAEGVGLRRDGNAAAAAALVANSAGKRIMDEARGGGRPRRRGTLAPGRTHGMGTGAGAMGGSSRVGHLAPLHRRPRAGGRRGAALRFEEATLSAGCYPRPANCRFSSRDSTRTTGHSSTKYATAAATIGVAL